MILGRGCRSVLNLTREIFEMTEGQIFLPIFLKKNLWSFYDSFFISDDQPTHIYESYEFWKHFPDFLHKMKLKQKDLGINFSVDLGTWLSIRLIIFKRS